MNGLSLAVLVFMPIFGAIISYLIGLWNKTVRDYFADLLVIIECLITVILFVSFADLNPDLLTFQIPGFAGFGLHFVMDGFRNVYALVAAIMWMMTTIFSKEYFAHYHNRNRYYMFMLITLGATMGVFLSADLYTTFIFFEIMSFTSYVWVVHDERKASLRAGETYLAVAVIGGMVMLMGLFMLYHTLGSLEISQLLSLAKASDQKNWILASAICISIGFGAKAGSFPLHIWLPKAHPVAPAPASALLSGILTKSGVFGLLVVSLNIMHESEGWGVAILFLGCITMFMGALLALFSIDLKRTLACSSMSQIGFIMVGIGMQDLLKEESVLAARGTILHMANHSLIKLVLFMAAGVIYMNLHKLDLNAIRGFGRKKPLFHMIFLSGALGIGGIPLFNGYISKTLLHEGIVEYTHHLAHLEHEMGGSAGILRSGDMHVIEWIFLISGGITVAYMTKLYVAIFVEKNADEAVQKKYDETKSYMNLQTKFALCISAILLPIMGSLPHMVMDPIAMRGVSIMNTGELEEVLHYFSFTNLKGGIISISIGAALYLLAVRFVFMKKKDGIKEYVNLWPERLDLENSFYRPIIAVFCSVMGFFCRICDSLVDSIVVLLRKTVYKDRPLPFELTEGTIFTYYLGSFLNYMADVLNKRFPNRKHKEHEYIHELAMLHVSWKENRVVISRTLSFGLLLFCFGFILTIVYLLGIYW